MAKGKVKWYNESKGFGFISSETGDELFVHRTGLYSSYEGLQQDQKVMFETKQDQKGLVAYNVKVID